MTKNKHNISITLKPIIDSLTICYIKLNNIFDRLKDIDNDATYKIIDINVNTTIVELYNDTVFNKPKQLDTMEKTIQTYEPKEISTDIDIKEHIASFDYYSGIKYAEQHLLKQTTEMSDVRKGTHFIVCCGDVMVLVKDIDYPHIKRRIF